MIKYKIINRKASRNQVDEIDELLRNKDFMQVLKCVKSYYIQGYQGDYGFILNEEGKDYIISVTIY